MNNKERILMFLVGTIVILVLSFTFGSAIMDISQTSDDKVIELVTPLSASASCDGTCSINSSYLNNTFVKKSGDTMTGDLFGTAFNGFSFSGYSYIGIENESFNTGFWCALSSSSSNCQVRTNVFFTPDGISSYIAYSPNDTWYYSGNIRSAKNVTADLFFIGDGSKLRNLKMNYTNIALLNQSNKFIGPLNNFTQDTQVGGYSWIGARKKYRIFDTGNSLVIEDSVSESTPLTVQDSGDVNMYANGGPITIFSQTDAVIITGGDGSKAVDIYGSDIGIHGRLNISSNVYMTKNLIVNTTITNTNASAWVDYVVCYLASGKLGHCTGAYILGQCTCVSN